VTAPAIVRVAKMMALEKIMHLEFYGVALSVLLAGTSTAFSGRLECNRSMWVKEYSVGEAMIEATRLGAGLSGKVI
jgi:hypothetical protein